MTQAAVATLDVVATLLDVFGFFMIPADVFQNLVLFGVGTFLLASAAEASSRAVSNGNQRRLLEAAKTAVGLIEVRQVPSTEIGSGLETLIDQSTEWTFRGGSGRYLRYATLPRLASLQARDVPVEIQILDPRDDSLSAEYARYRQLQRPEVVRRPNEGPSTSMYMHPQRRISQAGYSAIRSTGNGRGPSGAAPWQIEEWGSARPLGQPGAPDPGTKDVDPTRHNPHVAQGLGSQAQGRMPTNVGSRPGCYSRRSGRTDHRRFLYILDSLRKLGVSSIVTSPGWGACNGRGLSGVAPGHIEEWWSARLRGRSRKSWGQIERLTRTETGPPLESSKP